MSTDLLSCMTRTEPKTLRVLVTPTAYVLHAGGKVHSGFTAVKSDHGFSGSEAQAWVSWVLCSG